MRGAWAAPLLLLLATSASATDNCKYPPVIGPDYAWADGASVHVNIDPGIPDFDRRRIQEAFDAWSIAMELAVTFYYTHNRDGTVPADAETGEFDAVQVTRALRNDQYIAHTKHGPGRGNLKRAYITYRPEVSSLMLPLVMAHEIGHTFGLDDCQECPPGSSTMVHGSNSTDDLYSVRPTPSTCDVESVRSIKQYRSGSNSGGNRNRTTCEKCVVTPLICDEVEGHRVCRPGEPKQALCCPMGIISLDDYASIPTCPYLDWYGPEQGVLCTATCDEPCVRKQSCGELPCNPFPHYCWKCPTGGPSQQNPPPDGPMGSTCDEMGWFGSGEGAACEAACGEPCRSKQWCGDGWCRDYPHYCWRCPGL